MNHTAEKPAPKRVASTRVSKVYGKIVKRVVKLEEDERLALVRLLATFCTGYMEEDETPRSKI